MRLKTRRWLRFCNGNRYLPVQAWIWALVHVTLGVVLGGCTVQDPDYCTSDSDCTRILGDAGASFYCHPTRHVCLTPASPNMCSVPDDCKNPALPHCDLSTGICGPCVQDGSDTSCQHLTSTPFCGTAAGGGTTCVACLQNTDCPASAPICDGQSCRACQKHTDCEGTLNCDDGSRCTDSLVCIRHGDFSPDRAGSCAQNGQSGHVIYVYAATAANCMDTNIGTDVGHPLCTLDAAFAAAQSQGRLYVRVLAAGKDYQPQTTQILTGHYVFIGAPVVSRGLPMATAEARGPIFQTFQNANVTVDGFDLLQDLNSGNTTTIQCSGTPTNNVPTFALLNSTLRGSAMAGSTSGGAAVDLANCQAVVSGNYIGLTNISDIMNTASVPSNFRGLKITNNAMYSGTSFLIQNNVIAGNWDLAVDLYDVSQTGVTFQFNTVVYNGRNQKAAPSAFGGVICPSMGTPVQLGYSLLFNNYTTTGTQFSMPGLCSFKQVVVGSGTAESNPDPQLIHQTPDLDPATLSLTNTPNNSMYVIGKAQPGNGDVFPTTDIIGTPRPQQSSGWDIGAYELRVSM